jgi:hypothetical protein
MINEIKSRALLNKSMNLLHASGAKSKNSRKRIFNFHTAIIQRQKKHIVGLIFDF